MTLDFWKVKKSHQTKNGTIKLCEGYAFWVVILNDTCIYSSFSYKNTLQKYNLEKNQLIINKGEK
jgi:hypothetical protein